MAMVTLGKEVKSVELLKSVELHANPNYKVLDMPLRVQMVQVLKRIEF